MPGNILFRPVEANLTHDTNWLGKMDPYCMFSLGTQRAKSSICKHGGTRPHWGDTVSLSTNTLATGLGSNLVRLEVFDKDRFRPDDHIAYTDIDLNEIEQYGSVARWYPLFHHKKPAGEILIEAAVQQIVAPVTTVVQETVVTAPVSTLVGESYVVGGPIQQTTTATAYTESLPLNQNIGYGAPLTNTATSYGAPLTNTATSYGAYTNVAPVTANTNAALYTADPALTSKVSALGPQGGFPHSYKSLGNTTNVGYSQRPGYTIGDTEANPTCQTNLDSNGGGFFNKPSKERRAEPYTLSMPGTYGIPHGMTVNTAGQVVPNVVMDRPAPIGTVSHPGMTGYVDGFNNRAGLGLSQPGLAQSTYTTGQPGFYSEYAQPSLGLNQGLNQPTLNQGLNQGLMQPNLGQGSFGTGLNNQTNFGSKF